MNETGLRPSLPWRRRMPGMHVAETEDGHTYIVEVSEAGWKVTHRARGKREKIGDPTQLLWVGKCRAENHYASQRQEKPSAQDVVKAAASVAARRSPPAAAAKEEPPKPKSAEPASRRKRRGASAQPEAPAQPTARAGKTQIPMEWTPKRERGRQYHVAEHEGGLFRILEVKGTDGFALFVEPTGGEVERVSCGSLGDCMARAEALRVRMVDVAAKRSKRRSPASSKPMPEAAGAPAPSEPEAAKAGDCGCAHAEVEVEAEAQPKRSRKRKPQTPDPARDRMMFDSLADVLRNLPPPQAAER